MFQSQTESAFSGKIDSALDALLGPSHLFETACAAPPQSEAERVLQEKCSLYELTESPCNIVPSLLPAKRKRGKKESATAGPLWFHMPAPEMTPEVKADLEAVQMRRFINPKAFYKKRDVEQLPKYFQIGTVLPSPEEPQSLHIAKDRKRKTLVEQMLMEDEEKQFSHRKLQAIEAANKKQRYRGPKTPKKRRLGMGR